MQKHFAIVSIKDGKVVNRKTLEKFFEDVKSKDGKYQLEASEITKRSLPQNRYLHAVLIPEFKNALNQVGYDAVKTNEQAKSIIKAMFLTEHIRKGETDECIPIVRHTSELTKEECTKLIEEVIKFAAENMGYQIAFPNEQTMFNY